MSNRIVAGLLQQGAQARIPRTGSSTARPIRLAAVRRTV